MHGHLDIVKYFIKENIFKCDLKTKYQMTPLHYAASHDHLDMLKYLVQECKCDLMCKMSLTCDYRNGATPLHLAAYNGHLSTVKHILESEYGIDADVETTNGSTPLQLAVLNSGNLTIVKYLIKKHKCNPFHRNRDVVHFGNKSKFNTDNPANTQGRSTIHLAASTGCHRIVEYLVSECDVDPNMRSCYAETALHVAAYWNHLPVVKYLTQLPNCDISCADSAHQWTSLHLAALNGHYEVVKYLAQLQVRDGGHMKRDILGNAPLHIAAACGHFEVVKFLCKEMGTSPAIKNYSNRTPLHLAFQKKHAEVALYLIVLLYSEYQDSAWL